MSDPRASRRAPALLTGVAIALGPTGCVGLTGCVVHTRGLEVEIALDLEISPALRAARVTHVDLLACPGETVRPHHHDASAPWSLPLSEGPESVLLTPVPGRYCDLRLQFEADGVAPRQAVLPLLCGEARRELTLSAESLAGGPIVLDVSGSSPASPDAPTQRQLDQMLRTLVVDACLP